MKWTGVSKALVLPAKQYTEAADKATYTKYQIPYKAKDEEDTSARPPWNNGYGCNGPDINDVYAAPAKLNLANVIHDDFKNNNRQGKDRKLRAKGCMEYCESKNKIIKTL